MKSLLVLCLVFVAVYGLPAKKTYSYDDSDESFFLFPFTRQQKKEAPSVVEVEVGDSEEESPMFHTSFFRPFFIDPFKFMSFGISDFFSTPSWFDGFLSKNIPEDAKKNSTSSTQIMGGHRVTVNETTYENEKNGAVYRVKVIEVLPVDSKEKDDKTPEVKDGEESTETALDIATRFDTESDNEKPKPDENSHDNEIHREEMLASYELQGDDPNVEMINFGNVQNGKHQGAVDLSSDIRVNKLLAENARRGGLFMVPPEVEVFDTLDYDYLAGKMMNNDDYQQQQQVIEPQLHQQIIKPEFNQRQK